MASGEEWLLRPVDQGMIRYESLRDGTVSLFDVARLNEYLDVREENQRRYRAATRPNG